MLKYSVALLIALAGLSGCSQEGDTIFASAEPQNQIHVVGQATVKAAPDIAQAQLGVQTFSVTLDEAIAENNSRADAVMAALSASGVAPADIQTRAFNVQPQRDFSKEDGIGEIVGYWVNNTVAVTLRDLAAVGYVLQAAIAAGANNVNSLVFTLDDAESVRNQARVAAMENARQRAESLAQAAGVELGKPVRIDEANYGGAIYQRGDFDEAAAPGAAVPVAPGELEISAQVDVVYEIR